MICPYCGNEVSENQTSCCGESAAHFVEVSDEDFIKALDFEHVTKLSEAYKI